MDFSLEGDVFFGHLCKFLLFLTFKSHRSAILVIKSVVESKLTFFIFWGLCCNIEIIIIGIWIIILIITLFLASLTHFIFIIDSHQSADFLLQTVHFCLIILVLLRHILFFKPIFDLCVSNDCEALVLFKWLLYTFQCNPKLFYSIVNWDSLCFVLSFKIWVY